jgi:cbb3-type cytochrome oxidase maturation protein
MASLLLLIPLGLVLLGVSIWAFFWAADHGQFDDLDTPASRILEEDAPVTTCSGKPKVPRT